MLRRRRLHQHDIPLLRLYQEKIADQDQLAVAVTPQRLVSELCRSGWYAAAAHVQYRTLQPS